MREVYILMLIGDEEYYGWQSKVDDSFMCSHAVLHHLWPGVIIQKSVELFLVVGSKELAAMSLEIKYD
jgi:hypothetical protein